MKAAVLFVLVAVVALVSCEVYFKETFDNDWESRWVQSKSSATLGKFKLSAGKHFGDEELNKGLQTSQDARFYDIASKFPKAFSNKDDELVISFSVKHEQKIDCGGGYVKILYADADLEQFNGDTDYSIMFGPDICGATKRVHVIFSYKGNNLLKTKDISAKSDELTHVYTLVVKPDNTYAVYIDKGEVASGSLYDDWEFLEPKEIRDPSQSKPADWDEEPTIADPNDEKPEGWDDIPAEIEDADAEQPDDWDEEEDGEWSAPMVPNPEYQGEWEPKQIPNPDYQGKWEADLIPNPDFVDDDSVYLYDNLGAIGVDIWQVKSGSVFDNFFVGNDLDEAFEFVDETYGATKDGEKKSFDAAEQAKREKEEAERKAREEAEAAAAEEEEDEEEFDFDEVENGHDEL